MMQPLEYEESTEAPNFSVNVSAETESTESDSQEETPSAELLTACGWTEEQLANALRGNLKQYASVFLEAEKTYHVNAVFLASIAAYESGWGESELAVERNNLFGIKSGKYFKRFSSKKACIMYTAELLSVNYLSPDGCYFRGYEVKDVCVCYCGSDSWARQVERIMNDINQNCLDQTRREEQDKSAEEAQNTLPNSEASDTDSQTSGNGSQNRPKKRSKSQSSFAEGSETFNRFQSVSLSY